MIQHSLRKHTRILVVSIACLTPCATIPCSSRFAALFPHGSNQRIAAATVSATGLFVSSGTAFASLLINLICDEKCTKNEKQVSMGLFVGFTLLAVASGYTWHRIEKANRNYSTSANQPLLPSSHIIDINP
jgi:hypothetical protein